MCAGGRGAIVWACPVQRKHQIRGGKEDIYSGLLYLRYEGGQAPVSGGFRLRQHTRGEKAAGKYWLLGDEGTTSPGEVGRNPKCRAGQVMGEWPEADNSSGGQTLHWCWW